MSPPKDLPGFYYDAEKNRYFPIKGPIPGSKCTSSSAVATSSSSNKESNIQVIRKGKRRKVSQLLSLREIQGRDIFVNSRKFHFHKQYEEIQASQPTILKFEDANHVHSAIERLCVPLHTQSGTKDALFLATNTTRCTLSFFEVGEPRDPINTVSVSLWWNGASSFAHKKDALLSFYARVSFPSEISCIKHRGDWTRALVTTLGSATSAGSLYTLDTNFPLGSPDHLFSLHGTVWTADCNPAGTHAALGTSLGSALVDLEAKTPLWIYRGKSDVLSQQFISSGNVVLCGLRNGSILAADIREKQVHHEQDFSQQSTIASNPHMTTLPLNRRERRRNFVRPQVDREISLGHVRMTSAVCSMASLLSDENYFLASSMDGSIKLFDIRALRNGGVQSYEGHVNSHSRLQLAVNPSETLLIAGGEDCMVRIWSIKSGELLFSEGFSEECCTNILWRDSRGHAKDRLDQSQNWGAWLGSEDGLFYMQGI